MLAPTRPFAPSTGPGGFYRPPTIRFAGRCTRAGHPITSIADLFPGFAEPAQTDGAASSVRHLRACPLLFLCSLSATHGFSWPMIAPRAFPPLHALSRSSLLFYVRPARPQPAMPSHNKILLPNSASGLVDSLAVHACSRHERFMVGGHTGRSLAPIGLAARPPLGCPQLSSPRPLYPPADFWLAHDGDSAPSRLTHWAFLCAGLTLCPRR